jgi:hypothetical protein
VTDQPKLLNQFKYENCENYRWFVYLSLIFYYQEFLKLSICKMDPALLANSLSRGKGGILFERQFQMDFYRYSFACQREERDERSCLVVDVIGPLTLGTLHAWLSSCRLRRGGRQE